MPAEGAVSVAAPAHRGVQVRVAREDPAWVRWTLTALAVGIVGLLIVVPVANVFAGALAEGVGAYLRNLVSDADTLHSVLLTLTVVPFALVLNVVFGLAAAWTISRFRFPGRTLLTSLIDLPFSVSPVVAGLMFVLIFGLQGYFGGFLRRDGYSVMPYVVATMAAFFLVVGYLLFLPTSKKRRTGFFRLSPWLVCLVGVPLVFAVLVVRSAGARRLAAKSEPQDHLRDPGPHPRDVLRHVSVRRARAHSRDGRGRSGRGACRLEPRCERLADVLARDGAER